MARKKQEGVKVGPSHNKRNKTGKKRAPATKIVLATGTCTEVCRVPVEACFHTPLHCVPRARPRKIQLSLEQIPEPRHHRARSAIERLIQTIVELECRIGVVRGHKRRRRPCKTQRCRPEKAR